MNLLNAIIGHLWGDFIFQNDEMALNKKKRSWPCFKHCFIWTMIVCFAGNWHHPLAVVWLFGTHFMLDRTQIVKNWMIYNGQEQFATGPLAPWSIIVVDQVLHILTLAAVDVVYRQQ